MRPALWWPTSARWTSSRARTGRSRGHAVKQDLVISAYKPTTGFEQRFLAEAGTEEGAWDFVRQHLAQLPVVV